MGESQDLSIPFADIQAATKNFTNLIGKGGFGNVYKGEISLHGELTAVAVKRLVNNLGQGLKEFWTEIQLLSSYKHPNLVSFLGFCDKGDEKILVYEYAERGSLDQYLSTNTLSWMQRVSICLDAARGLDYLHNRVARRHRVIHRDIKSPNILLDCNWKAKISDLGLAKIGLANERYTFMITNACGTQGYCDPAYIETGILTKKSDVYSFGVVLFEVLCGRPCYMNVNSEQRFLGPFARRHYKKGTLDEIIPPDLRKQINLNSLNTFSTVAQKCLLKDRTKRPSMEIVVRELEEALKCQLEIHPRAAVPQGSSIGITAGSNEGGNNLMTLEEPLTGISQTEEAARAYDREARKTRGKKAKVNFPNGEDPHPYQQHNQFHSDQNEIEVCNEPLVGLSNEALGENEYAPADEVQELEEELMAYESYMKFYEMLYIDGVPVPGNTTADGGGNASIDFWSFDDDNCGGAGHQVL